MGETPDYPDLFEIHTNARGDECAITCKLCGMKSYHPTDILWRYCANCHEFLDDIWPPVRQQMLDRAQEQREVK